MKETYKPELTRVSKGRGINHLVQKKSWNFLRRARKKTGDPIHDSMSHDRVSTLRVTLTKFRIAAASAEIRNR
jgi:hypothetical protein